MNTSADRAAPSPRRTAVLVVHGIGNQAPYSTLDRVVRGIRTVLGDRVDRLGHISAAANNRVASGVRFSLNSPLPRSGGTELDVFEGYWAPMSVPFSTARGLFAWLAQTLLAPFRRWSQIRLDHISLGRRLELVFGEVIAALLAVSLITVVGSLLYEFGDVLTQNPLTEYDADLLVAVEAAAAVTAAAFLLRAISGTLGPRTRRLRRLGHEWYVTRILGERATFADEGLDDRSAGEDSRRVWGRAAWVVLTISAAVVVLIEWRQGPVHPDDQAESTALIVREVSDFDRDFWTALAIVGGAFVVYRVLSGIASDVAVYVSDDDATASGRLRNHILVAIEGQLRSLLEDPDYDRVHVVAHSLGTVITHDALNRLRQEIEHQDAHRCDDDLLSVDAYNRFGSFVSVACPLDHIAYAWRSDGDEQKPIQRQLIERRRALRTAAPVFDAGRFSLDEEFGTGTRRGYYPTEPQEFAWLNISARPDPISSPLVNFRPDEHVVVGFGPLTFAHTKVLDDQRTYQTMVAYL